MNKHKRTMKYKDFIKMFPNKYSSKYNMECIRKHKNRCIIYYNKNEQFKYIESL